MGIYIKGATKEWLITTLKEHDLWDYYEFSDSDIIEVKAPHGRLIDADELEVLHYEDADGHHLEYDAPTVIEVESDD